MVGSQLNKSFFYAVDTLHGWGNMSHFTFFGEFNRSWSGIAYVEASITILLFILAVIGNVFILVFIARTKAARTITNYFVWNLAFADVLFVISAPLVASVRITSTWRLGKEMCNFLNYWMFVCGFVMIWTMVIISIHRYVCLNSKVAVSNSKRLTLSHVIIICFAIWSVALVLFSPIAIYFHLTDIQTEQNVITVCSLSWPRSQFRFSLLFTCFLLIVAFIIPLSIIIFNYISIFRKFWKSKRAVANSTQAVVVTNQRRNQNLRVVKALVLLVVMFVLMWTPLFITFGLIQYDAMYEYNDLPSSALVWTVVVAYMNAVLNPFLYGVLNQRLRTGLCASCALCRSNGVKPQAESTRPHIQTASFRL